MLQLMWTGLAMAGGDVLRVGAEEEFATVGEAVSAARDGDTVHIVGGAGPEQDGSYRETVHIDGQSISIVGEDDPILRPQEEELGFFLISKKSVVDMTGIEIDGGKTHRAFGVNGGAQVVLRSSMVTNTRTNAGSGGAVFIDQEGARLEVEASTFRNSFAPLGGGFFSVTNGGDLVVRDSHLTGGHTNGGGGAIACETRGRCDLYSSTVSGNRAGTSGGAVACRGSSICDVMDSRLFDNTTTGEGGAIWQSTASTLLITRSWFCGNVASGAGALALRGDAYVDRSVFMSNVATEEPGGAIRAFGLELGQDVDLHHNNFIANEAESGGAMVSTSRSHFTHNIVTDHSTPDPVEIMKGKDEPFKHEFNLYWRNSRDETTVGLDGTEVVGDPMFTDVVDPVSLGEEPHSCVDSDLNLRPGSAAIDAGNPSQLDPDGTVVDIGAFPFTEDAVEPEPSNPLADPTTIPPRWYCSTSQAFPPLGLVGLVLLVQRRRRQ